MVDSLRLPVTFLAVLCTGFIGGLLWGTAMEQQQLTVLDATNWTLARQSIDSVFGSVLPWAWNITLILLFVAAWLNPGRSRWMFLSAGSLLLVGIVLTIVFELPINKQIASWSPNAVPANWMELRARWIAFHHARTAAGMLASVCALVGFVKR